MTDVEQPASVPSFGGFGEFTCLLPLLQCDYFFVVLVFAIDLSVL